MSEGVTHRRYLKIAAAVLAALLVAVAGFNLAVDPYGLFGARLVAGFNARKLRADQEARFFKTRVAERARAHTVILGNSRAEIGIDPESRSWPSGARPVVNLALPGTGPAAAALMLSTAATAQMPVLVVLGVDFPDFLRGPQEPLYAPTPVVVGGNDGIGPEVLTRSVLSMDSLWNSLLTVARQHDPEATELTALGFNPLRDYRALVRNEGHYSLFQQKNVEYASRLASGPRGVVAPGRVWSPEFEQIRTILEFCRAHGVAVRVMIYPYHADVLEIISRLGLWPAFEEWKRLLVAVMEDPALVAADLQLWDFSGYSVFATETLPRPGDHRAQMEWYWESGHFKPSLGDLLIADLTATVPRLGHRLTRETIEDSLRAIRAGQDAYRLSRPDAAARIAALVQSAAGPGAEPRMPR